LDQLEIGALDFLILSILVLFAGMRLTRAVPVLERNYILPAVTGGILFSVAAALLESFGGIALSFDMDLRDLLLLAFFATVGLNAKLRMLAAGGKALVILVACAGVVLPGFLTALAGSLIPIVVVMFAQIVVITVFVVGLVFRLMGRDYDACVISAGFVGQGLPGGPPGRRLLRRPPERRRDQALHTSSGPVLRLSFAPGR
jgi:ESS family glutamate:Na+ symporter